MPRKYFYLPFSILLLAEINLIAQQPRLVLPVAHTDRVSSAKFSPDGKKIVTASSDETAKIWDAVTGKLLFDLKASDGEVGFVAFSGDGTKLLTLHRAGRAKVRVWEVETGKMLFVLSAEPRSSINYAVFSPDGKRIATGSHDLAVRIWDSGDGRVLAILKGHKGFVVSAQFSEDGSRITTVSTDSTHKTWDITSGVLLHNKVVNWEPPGDDIPVLSPDRKKILAISPNGSTIHVSDAKNGKRLFDLEGHTQPVTTIDFSPDGSKVITGSLDRTAITWDLNNGRVLAHLKGYTYDIHLPVFTNDSKTLAIISGDETVKHWDIMNGRMTYSLKGHKGKINDVKFSGDGKKMLTASDDQTAMIWDAENGNAMLRLEGHTKNILTARFSPDNSSIITASADFTARTWNAESGRMMMEFKGHTKNVSAAEFTRDGARVITTSLDKTARIWNALSGKLLVELAGHKAQINTFKFSPDGKKIATASSDNTARIWDTETGKLLADLNGNENILDVRDVQFSPGGKKLITWALNGADVWDVETGKWLHSMKEGITSASFSPDGKKIFAIEYNEASIWDSGMNKSLTRLKGHSQYIRNAQFSPDGKWVITVSADHTAKIWDAESGGLLYTFFAVGHKDFFVQTAAGFYQCTPDAAKLLHYVTKDQKLITFEQLDVKYNRPDKVLEAIGNTDTALIKSYRKAWEKRIKKLGIDTTAFREGYNVPETEFLNRSSIDFEQKKREITLHITGSDSTYKLDRFNIWINEVPLCGHRGISINGKQANSFDTSITVILSQGVNQIEASVTNINGAESYRMPLMVNYTPPMKQKEMTRFIGIGIDQFADNKYNLQYSAKDIRDLSNKLKEKYGSDIIIDTLFNENVTTENIAALKSNLIQTSVNDKVIIAYSGHGLLSKDYDYFLSTWSVNFDKPEENGLPYDALENLLDGIPARKKLLLIDACHSGEVDKEDLVVLSGTPDSLIKGLTPLAYKKEGQLGLKNSFELMQSLFVNVGKSTGATVISAAAGTQFALERNDLKNGVFTYAILEAMNQNETMKVSDLRTFVSERVENLTKGLQKPTSRNETISVDWQVW